MVTGLSVWRIELFAISPYIILRLRYLYHLRLLHTIRYYGQPKDGYDVVSTININIQDIAHHALLKQLETYQADHGCAVVMEVATREIKAISNLGRNKDGSYGERFNYALGETYEPGSVFKTVSFVVA